MDNFKTRVTAQVPTFWAGTAVKKKSKTEKLYFFAKEQMQGLYMLQMSLQINEVSKQKTRTIIKADFITKSNELSLPLKH